MKPLSQTVCGSISSTRALRSPLAYHRGNQAPRMDLDEDIDERNRRRCYAGDPAGLRQRAGRTRFNFSFISRERPLKNSVVPFTPLSRLTLTVLRLEAP